MRLVLLSIITLGFSVTVIECVKPKNTCKSFWAYLIDFNNECYHDPDVFEELPDILERRYERHEAYSVNTEDGYINGVYRIPKENPVGAVVFQHPLNADASMWLIGKDSPAELFHKMGYDVWLPNYRGTTHSSQHINMTPAYLKYWDFSWHEKGIYDISAVVRFVKQKTNSSSIIMIGHSLGTTASLVYASMRPEEARDAVKVIIVMGPPVYMANIGHRFLWKTIVVGFFFDTLAMRVVLPYYKSAALFFNQYIIRKVQRVIFWIPTKIKVYIFSLALGWTPDESDAKMINVFCGHIMRPLSSKTINHFGQIIKSEDGIFRMFDYGKEKNKEVYDSEIPPEYPLHKIQTPVYLMSGEYDVFSRDVDVIYDKMSDVGKSYGQHKISGFNHGDFVYGKNRRKKVYNRIFELLNKIG